MSLQRHARTLDEIARDLDLLVFRLERAPARDAEGVELERVRLRRELEQLRERVVQASLDLQSG